MLTRRETARPQGDLACAKKRRLMKLPYSAAGVSLKSNEPQEVSRFLSSWELPEIMLQPG
jgi:hypothetical protein